MMAPRSITFEVKLKYDEESIKKISSVIELIDELTELVPDWMNVEKEKILLDLRKELVGLLFKKRIRDEKKPNGH